MIDLRTRRDLRIALRWLPLVLVPVLLLASTYPGLYRVPPHYWALAMGAAAVFVAGARWPLPVSLTLSALAVPMLRTPAWGLSGLVPFLGAVALIDVIARTHRRTIVVVATVAWGAAVVVGRQGAHDTSIGAVSILVETLAYVGLPLLLGLYLRGQRDLADNLRLRAADAQARARVDERAALARELHDLVAHHIASIILRIAVANHVVREADPRVVEVLDDVRATATAALADIRKLLVALRDPTLATVALVDPMSVASEVEAAADRVRAAGFAVDVELDSEITGLDAIGRLTLLRLVQESLTNVMKHADRGAPVLVRIVRDGDEVAVRVRSGGSGVANPPGHGIIGMRERAELAGGTLVIGNTADGWIVEGRLPMEAP
ncbi:sensor histidine kinase [Nocardia camponoti]|uniref:sensor histidine kinase n=1 Tax=Nocardia camponoti TaxID=1616106 RepID=UPI00166AFB16|nr:histidine kinase [Nocardia camponoti]